MTPLLSPFHHFSKLRTKQFTENLYKTQYGTYLKTNTCMKRIDVLWHFLYGKLIPDK